MPTTTNPTIARLARLVDESGMPRYQVAEGAGLSAGNLSRLLSGERNPSIATVERVLAAIGYHLTFEITEG